MRSLGPEALDQVEEALGVIRGGLKAQVAGDCAAAAMFAAMTGWRFALGWLLAGQLLRVVRSTAITVAKRAGLPHECSAQMDLVFQSLQLFTLGVIGDYAAYQYGPWGVAAALSVQVGTMIYVSQAARKSAYAATAFLAPSFAHLAILFSLAAWHHAPGPALLSLAIGLLMSMGLSINVWRGGARMALAEAEARRRAEAATAAKSSFVAMVSHELRTPISGILAGADEIGRTAGDAAIRANAGLILESGQMMRRLLDDLLDLSKIEAGRMSVERIDFDLRQLVGDTVRFWAPQARLQALRFRLEGAHSLPRWVEGDPTRLRQILNNLFSNALKFTKTGSITLKVSAAPWSNGQIDLTIQVIDTGKGMSADQVGRLFQAFEQLSDTTARTHGGTGLGLNISRQLAHLMGGDLSARSAEGLGSSFRLNLTLAPGQPVAADGKAEVAGRTDRIRALVVDDHSVNRQAFALILQTLCEEVACVEDGEEALQALAVEPFDVVLMDLNMPRMGGLEATRRLRAQAGPNRATPVIALTASVSPQEVDTCLAAGMNSFVMKPVEPRELIAAIDEVMSAHQPNRSSAAA